MTELEKIERAKMYMDKLANGINPIDDTIAPDDDLINNVRLSRCFFFVSDVLRQVIENGGTKLAANKKPKKIPLEIPIEKRSQFAYSEVPIPASEIAKRINALADNDCYAKTYLFRNPHVAYGNWNDGMGAYTRRKANEKADENW